MVVETSDLVRLLVFDCIKLVLLHSSASSSNPQSVLGTKRNCSNLVWDSHHLWTNSISKLS